MRRRRADLALVGAAFLFGTTFLVVQEAVEDVEPLPFIAVRFAIAAAVLAPVARRRLHRGIVAGGAAAGLALAAGYVLQTVGLQYTTSSVSAFITYLLVVLVPVLSALVIRRPPNRRTVAGIAIAVVGLALLTGGGGGGFGRGELLTAGCALAFAAHIVVLARVAPRHDVVGLTAVQLAVVAALSAGPAAAIGFDGFGAGAWLAIVYTAVAATAGAFCLQVYGQRVVGPSRAALLLLLEPVFAAIVGYGAGERLGWGGAAGAVLIVGAVVVTELPALTVGSSSGEPEASSP